LDAPLPPDERRLRDALGCFATGITVVTTRATDGEPVGLTVNSFNSVSLTPPLVLFSIDRTTRTFNNVTSANHFAINVLCEEQRDLSQRFARREPDRWQGIAFTDGASGVPLLDGCLASFECERAATHDGGDHVIVIGRVVGFRHAARGRPLLYFRGQYRGVDAASDHTSLTAVE
jgi:flavin reductase (DIM6/NTAB) family NADH-FMN oxidoreductase RutF